MLAGTHYAANATRDMCEEIGVVPIISVVIWWLSSQHSSQSAHAPTKIHTTFVVPQKLVHHHNHVILVDCLLSSLFFGTNSFGTLVSVGLEDGRRD